MVPLIARRAHAEHRLEAPLVAFRGAVAALPTRDDAVVDRLFALECLARAGRDARDERNQLLSVRRAAEDFIEDGWEADVPHANVLGQALSTIAALDDDPPMNWSELLDETVDALAARQTRHGVTTTPLVLVSVIRGLTTSGRAVPKWLLDGTRAYFEAGPTVAASAELAEALNRHRSGAQLSAHAAEIVFSDRHRNDPGVSIARWWLAERIGSGAAIGAEKVAAARAQAITAPTPGNVRLAAMLAEVSARAVETLVLLPESELELLRARSRRRSLIENYAWRTTAVMTPLILAIIYLRTTLGWLGDHQPSARTLSGLAFVLTALVGVVVTIAGWHAAKRLERDLGLFGVVMSIAMPLVPAALVYFLYPG